MNKKQLLYISIILFNTSIIHSQQKESIDSDSIQKSLTISESGMYSSSKSEVAVQHFDNATEFSKNQDFKEAKESYLKAIDQDSNFIEAYDNLGLTCRRLEQYDEAIMYYKKSIELFPEGQTALQNLAVVYSIKKEYQNAIESYIKINELFPESPEGYFGIANSYMMLSKFEEGLPYAKKALDIYKLENSHHLGDGYYLIGLIHFYAGENELAKEQLKFAKEHGVIINSDIEEKIFGTQNSGYANIKLEKSEDYELHEAKFIEGYNWLINTPIYENQEKRSEINKFLLDWATGSPYVSIELNEKIINYTEQSDCLMIFIGGWISHALKTKIYDNKQEGSLMGTEAVIKFYKSNKKKIGTNKEIEKLIKLKKKNKLNKYIKSNI